MITIEPEKNPYLDTCQSCMVRGPVYAVKVTTVHDDRHSSGTEIRLCAQCKAELGRLCADGEEMPG